MAETKKQTTTTTSSNDDLFFTIIIGVCCIIPFCIAIIPWIIVIPFIKADTTLRIQKATNSVAAKIKPAAEKPKGFKNKIKSFFKKFGHAFKQFFVKKWPVLLTLGIILFGGLFGFWVWLMTWIDKSNAWFNGNAGLNGNLACAGFVGLSLSIIITPILYFIYRHRQNKFLNECDSIIDLKEVSLKDRQKLSTGKIVWEFFTHYKMCKKAWGKFAKSLIDEGKAHDKGSVILNKQHDITITSDALRRGTVVFGTTGTGKSNTIFHFCRATCEVGNLLIIVNGKADKDMTDKLRTLAGEYDYHYHVWDMVGSQDCNFCYNVFKNKTSKEIITSLLEIDNYQAIASAGRFDVLHYQELNKRIYQFYIRLMEKCYLPNKPHALDFAILQQFCDSDKIEHNLMQPTNVNWRNLSESEQREFNAEFRAVFSKAFATKNYQSQVSQLSNTFKTLSNLDPEKKILSGQGTSISDLIKDKGKHILLFNIDSSSNPVEAAIIGRLVIMDIRQNMALLQKNKKKLMLCLDEFGSFATPSINDMLEKGRSFGCQTLLSMQTLSGLRQISETFASSVLGNCNNKIIHRIIDANGPEQIATLFGTLSDFESTYQTDEGELGTKGSLRLVDHYVFHPNDIKRLPDHHAFVSTLEKGIVKIYNGAIDIDYCNIEPMPIDSDNERVKFVNSMTEKAFQAWRLDQWQHFKQKNQLDLSKECPVDWMPSKESYIIKGIPKK